MRGDARRARPPLPRRRQGRDRRRHRALAPARRRSRHRLRGRRAAPARPVRRAAARGRGRRRGADRTRAERPLPRADRPRAAAVSDTPPSSGAPRLARFGRGVHRRRRRRGPGALAATSMRSRSTRRRSRDPHAGRRPPADGVAVARRPSSSSSRSIPRRFRAPLVDRRAAVVARPGARPAVRAPPPLWSGRTTTTPATGEPVWWWAREGRAARGDGRRRGRRHPSRRPRGLDRRRPALERARSSACRRPLGDGRGRTARSGSGRPGRAAVLELAPDQLAAVPHDGGPVRVIAPAGSGKTRVLTERDPPPARRARLRPRRRCSRSPTTRRPSRSSRRASSALEPRTRTLNSLGYSSLAGQRGGRPRVLNEPEARDVDRGGLPDPAAAPDQHRPGRPLPRRARRWSGSGSRDPAEVEAERDDVPGFAEHFERYRERARGARRRRLRRADLRRARGDAPRRRLPAPGPGRAPPPARRRVPGPDTRPRTADPAAVDAGDGRLRRRRRRPDDLRPRRRRPALPRRLPALLP